VTDRSFGSPGALRGRICADGPSCRHFRTVLQAIRLDDRNLTIIWAFNSMTLSLPLCAIMLNGPGHGHQDAGDKPTSRPRLGHAGNRDSGGAGPVFFWPVVGAVLRAFESQARRPRRTRRSSIAHVQRRKMWTFRAGCFRDRRHRRVFEAELVKRGCDLFSGFSTGRLIGPLAATAEPCRCCLRASVVALWFM